LANAEGQKKRRAELRLLGSGIKKTKKKKTGRRSEKGKGRRNQEKTNIRKDPSKREFMPVRLRVGHWGGRGKGASKKMGRRRRAHKRKTNCWQAVRGNGPKKIGDTRKEL